MFYILKVSYYILNNNLININSNVFQDRLLNYVANELLYNTTTIAEDNALNTLKFLAYNHQGIVY